MKATMEDCEKFFKHFNPLYIKDEAGLLVFYPTYYDCYEDFFSKLKTWAPRGFIDPVLLLVTKYGLTLYVAEMMVVDRGRKADSYVIVDYSRPNKETFSELMWLCMLVHDACGTAFKEDQFKTAFNYYFNV